MTPEQWNELQPGDVVEVIGAPELRYRVKSLGPTENWGDTGTDEVWMSHQIELELIEEPYEPWDIGRTVMFDPGECKWYQKSALTHSHG